MGRLDRADTLSRAVPLPTSVRTEQILIYNIHPTTLKDGFIPQHKFIQWKKSHHHRRSERGMVERGICLAWWLALLKKIWPPNEVVIARSVVFEPSRCRPPLCLLREPAAPAAASPPTRSGGGEGSSPPASPLSPPLIEPAASPPRATPLTAEAGSSHPVRRRC